MADRQPEQFRQGADPQLPHQAGASELDGPRRELQAGRDLLVRPTITDHPQDFPFLVGQFLQPLPDLPEVGLAAMRSASSSTARWIFSSSTWPLNGFSRNSTAPSFIARTAIWTSA